MKNPHGKYTQKYKYDEVIRQALKGAEVPLTVPQIRAAASELYGAPIPHASTASVIDRFLKYEEVRFELVPSSNNRGDMKVWSYVHVKSAAVLEFPSSDEGTAA